MRESSSLVHRRDSFHDDRRRDTIENQLATLNAVGDSAECRGVDEPRDTAVNPVMARRANDIDSPRRRRDERPQRCHNGVQITTGLGLEEDELYKASTAMTIGTA